LMAVNAHLSSRRARTLGAQRAALLDDVGLLQTALLAPVPAHAGDAHISVAYRPAAGPAAGGDFYDVITLGPSRTGLLLGDVSGHGREALRHAALVRYTVRTFLAGGHDPAEALALSDDCLDADLDGHFATVIAAVYDHDTHTLRYAKAGAQGRGDGLGIRPEMSELTLDRGSTVCLFTDGIIEARRDGALLGRDTLVALLDHGHPSGPELLDRVVAHADQVTDDLAVCLLSRP
jgi:phosphoserine phosphatase RsbU/P